MYILAPSILAADFGNLRKEIQTVSEAGAQYIHIDVMDGMFVPSISFGMPVIQSVRSCTDKVFDVHMMVEEPGPLRPVCRQARPSSSTKGRYSKRQLRERSGEPRPKELCCVEDAHITTLHKRGRHAALSWDARPAADKANYFRL